MLSTHSTASRTRNITIRSLSTRAKRSHNTRQCYCRLSRAPADTRTNALLLQRLLLNVRGVLVAKWTTSSRRTRDVAVSAVVERAQEACECGCSEVAAPTAAVRFPRRQASSVAETVCMTPSAVVMLWLRVVVLRKATTLIDREQRSSWQVRNVLTPRAE